MDKTSAEHLRDFCRWWLKRRDEDFKRVKRLGLCALLDVYISCDDELRRDAAAAEALDEHFRDCLLADTGDHLFPFNYSMSTYHAEGRVGERHLNPMRVAWVTKHANLED